MRSSPNRSIPRTRTRTHTHNTIVKLRALLPAGCVVRSANIQNPDAKIRLHPCVSDTAASALIRGLLVRCSVGRLGCRSGGTRDIKTIRWLRDFDFDALLAGRVQPPYVPTVTGMDDFSHFELDNDLKVLDKEALLAGDPYTNEPGEWDEHF